MYVSIANGLKCDCKCVLVIHIKKLNKNSRKPTDVREGMKLVTTKLEFYEIMTRKHWVTWTFMK